MIQHEQRRGYKRKRRGTTPGQRHCQGNNKPKYFLEETDEFIKVQDYTEIELMARDKQK